MKRLLILMLSLLMINCGSYTYVNNGNGNYTYLKFCKNGNFLFVEKSGGHLIKKYTDIRYGTWKREGDTIYLSYRNKLLYYTRDSMAMVIEYLKGSHDSIYFEPHFQTEEYAIGLYLDNKKFNPDVSGEIYRIPRVPFEKFYFGSEYYSVLYQPKNKSANYFVIYFKKRVPPNMDSLVMKRKIYIDPVTKFIIKKNKLFPIYPYSDEEEYSYLQYKKVFIDKYKYHKKFPFCKNR